MKHIPTQIMSLALPCNQDQAKTFKGEQITDRPISLMSINIEIPNNILANKTTCSRNLYVLSRFSHLLSLCNPMDYTAC